VKTNQAAADMTGGLHPRTKGKGAAGHSAGQHSAVQQNGQQGTARRRPISLYNQQKSSGLTAAAALLGSRSRQVRMRRRYGPGRQDSNLLNTLILVGWLGVFGWVQATTGCKHSAGQQNAVAIQLNIASRQGCEVSKG